MTENPFQRQSIIQKQQPGYVQPEHDQLLKQQGQQRYQIMLQEKERKTPAIVRRVLADILVFIEVEDAGDAVGLVFKPNKIVGYAGEPLDSLGIRVGATIGEVSWNAHTLRVHSVTMYREAGEPLQRSAT